LDLLVRDFFDDGRGSICREKRSRFLQGENELGGSREISIKKSIRNAAQM